MNEMIEIMFKTVDELADFMLYCADEKKYVVAALYYTEAKALMRELLSYSEIDVSIIDLEDEDFFGYDLEYYVTLDPDGIMSVEKAYDDGRYLLTDADMYLISSDASSKLISTNVQDGIMYEFSIGKNVDDTADDHCDCQCFRCNGCSDVHMEVEEEAEYEDEFLDEFSEAELIFDENHEVVGARVKADDLFKYLFGF